MTDKRFITLVRGYAAQSRRTRKSFAGAVNVALNLRLDAIEEMDIDQKRKDELESAALRTVVLEYRAVDPEYVRTLRS